MDRDGILDVDSGDVGEHFDADAALWLGYAFNPLVLYAPNDEDRLERAAHVIQHRFGGNLVGALSLFEWVELGVDLPVVFAQMGDSHTIGAPGLTTEGGLAIVGLGDLRLMPKVRLLRGHEHYVDLALILGFTLPTGFPFQQYMGEGFPTLLPELAVSKQFGQIDKRLQGLRLAANVGYRARAHTEFFGATLGHELTYRAGVAYDIEPRWQVPLELSASLDGAFGVWPWIASTAQSPLEGKLGAAYHVWGPLTLFAGAGAGLIAGAGVPDLRVFGGVRFVNRNHDRDEDGVRDEFDGCPDDKEDVDGHQDGDGCPDYDNDADGIPDAQDQCRDEAEDKDDFDDQDGCPDTDNDQDGVLDVDDKCKNDAEDKDEFEDDDGCPDTDNDQDGVLDVEDNCKNEAGVQEAQGCPIADSDGDGVKDDVDQCPDQAEDKDGFEDEDGCPDVDNDQDGVEDAADKCPMAAEDKDGFEDDDGCPDTDNDKDGILDVDDKCPLKPETVNGNKDEDGCPDRGKTKVVVSKTKIEILEKVYFASGKSRIRPRSFNLLDQVATILRTNPWIKQLRIEGHTDDRGSAESNQKLSQARAEAVKAFLVDAGIEAERLEAKGYGEEKPIESNDTRAGREANRRVTFQIAEGASDSTQVDGQQTAEDAPATPDAEGAQQ